MHLSKVQIKDLMIFLKFLADSVVIRKFYTMKKEFNYYLKTIYCITLSLFFTHRKTNSQARCECLHLIKIDCQVL